MDYFRVTAENAGSGAGGIKQDGVKRLFIEIREVMQSIGADYFFGLQVQALHVFTERSQPLLCIVKRSYLGIAVEQLGGFAAGSGTEVKNAFAV